jgi:hypothetical protein
VHPHERGSSRVWIRCCRGLGREEAGQVPARREPQSSSPGVGKHPGAGPPSKAVGAVEGAATTKGGGGGGGPRLWVLMVGWKVGCYVGGHKRRKRCRRRPARLCSSGRAGQPPMLLRLRQRSKGACRVARPHPAPHLTLYSGW